MRPSLAFSAALLLGLFACAPKRQLARPIPTEPLSAEAASLRRPEDSAYAARVRQELTQRGPELRACFAQVPGREALDAGAFTRALYVSPGVAYFPQRSAAGPLHGLEQCAAQLLRKWKLPLPVVAYESVWALFHLERGAGPATATERRSPLFELEGLLVSLELTGQSPYERGSPYGMDVFANTPGNSESLAEENQRIPWDKPGGGMTRPVLLEGHPIQYTQQAIDHAVGGIMRVKCIITREGNLEACRVLRAVPFMESAVLQSLLRNRYTPVTYRGVPVAVDYTFTFNFARPKAEP
jgi:hypothetical protein